MKAFLSILVLLFKYIYSKYVYTMYDVFSDGVFMEAKIKLGNYVWIYYIEINMFDNYTLYDEWRYNEMIESPKEMYYINGNNVPAKKATEQMVFRDENYLNFTFFNIAEEDLSQYVNEAVSFPLRPSNKTYAFMHQLYNANMIDKLIMYFCSCKYFDTDQEVGGMIYFGGMDESLLHNKYNVTIKPLNGVKEWKVKMNKYIFHIINDDSNSLKETQIEFKNTKEVILNIGEPLIHFPQENYNILRNVYFKTAIDKDLCREEENNDNTLITCKLEALTYLGDIDFMFDNSLLTFNLKNILGKYILQHNNDMYVIDVCFMKNKYNNTWIFGEIFFRNYIARLDFEKEEITFYSNNMFITIDNITFRKQLFLCISTCLLLTVIYLIIIQFWYIRK